MALEPKLTVKIITTVFTAVVVPFYLFLWHFLGAYYNTKQRRQSLFRIAIWRMSLVRDGCYEKTQNGFRHALAVIRGTADYTQISPTFEDGASLGAVLFQIVPYDSNRPYRPAFLQHLMELEAALNALCTDAVWNGDTLDEKAANRTHPAQLQIVNNADSTIVTLQVQLQKLYGKKAHCFSSSPGENSSKSGSGTDKNSQNVANIRTADGSGNTTKD